MKEPAAESSREKLIRYRRHLIPLFVFPSVFFAGGTLLPQEFVAPALFPLFFGVTFYGALPYLQKKESYSYWIMAMGVWCAGIVPAFVISGLLQLFIGNN